jgi:DNA-binding PadR family transcriptional regulator
VLDMAVLGLLKEQPMSGYELKKALKERLGRTRTSDGSLYPTLKRLARQAAVELEFPRSEVGRRKNVYRITPAGDGLFEQLLEQALPQATEDRDAFMLRFSFFRYTKPETRRRLLERRRGYLQDQLAKFKDSVKNLRERMDAYSYELMQHSMSETEHDIRWLDTMLEAESRN